MEWKKTEGIAWVFVDIRGRVVDGGSPFHGVLAGAEGIVQGTHSSQKLENRRSWQTWGKGGGMEEEEREKICLLKNSLCIRGEYVEGGNAAESETSARRSDSESRKVVTEHTHGVRGGKRRGTRVLYEVSGVL